MNRNEILLSGDTNQQQSLLPLQFSEPRWKQNSDSPMPVGFAIAIGRKREECMSICKPILYQQQKGR